MYMAQNLRSYKKINLENMMQPQSTNIDLYEPIGMRNEDTLLLMLSLRRCLFTIVRMFARRQSRFYQHPHPYISDQANVTLIGGRVLYALIIK